jgi:hypothetical protein
MPRTVGTGHYRRPGQRRQALGDQNRQIEHAQADCYRKQPSVQLAGDPVGPDQMVLHRATSLHAAADNISPECCDATLKLVNNC